MSEANDGAVESRTVPANGCPDAKRLDDHSTAEQRLIVRTEVLTDLLQGLEKRSEAAGVAADKASKAGMLIVASYRMGKCAAYADAISKLRDILGTGERSSPQGERSGPDNTEMRNPV
jgi:hypothetical protein